MSWNPGDHRAFRTMDLGRLDDRQAPSVEEFAHLADLEGGNCGPSSSGESPARLPWEVDDPFHTDLSDGEPKRSASSGFCWGVSALPPPPEMAWDGICALRSLSGSIMRRRVLPNPGSCPLDTGVAAQRHPRLPHVRPRMRAPARPGKGCSRSWAATDLRLK